MQFSGPFDGGYATVDQFFNDSNQLTMQYPQNDGSVGFGYTQNTSGYDWDGQQGGGGGDHRGGHSGHNEGFHSDIPRQAGGTCGTGYCAGGGGGADPQALSRANLEMEMRGEGQQRPAKKAEEQPALEITDYLYHIGPDALDFDSPQDAPPSGKGYWKARMPSLIINGVAVAIWVWLWSHFNFSTLLPGGVASSVYWGFIAIMGFGAFQSDHRAARYEEEREQIVSVESNLQLMLKVIAGAALLTLTFKLVEGRSSAFKQGTYAALSIGFFMSLFGLVSFGAKKRGESVRRLRKIKSAVLNLSIGLIVVAAMLTFNVGTGLANTGVIAQLENNAPRYIIQQQPAKKGVAKKQTGGQAGGQAGGNTEIYGGNPDPIILPQQLFVMPPPIIQQQPAPQFDQPYAPTMPPAKGYSVPQQYSAPPTEYAPQSYQASEAPQFSGSPTMPPPNTPVGQPPYPAY